MGSNSFLPVVDLTLGDSIIILEHKGRIRSLTKQDITELLELRETLLKRERMPETIQDDHLPSFRKRVYPKQKSLASLGIVISHLSKMERLREEDEEKLISYLKAFDGNLQGRRTSQAGAMLRDLLEHKGISILLKDQILAFLARYPEIEMIPHKLPAKS